MGVVALLQLFQINFVKRFQLLEENFGSNYLVAAVDYLSLYCLLELGNRAYLMVTHAAEDKCEKARILKIVTDIRLPYILRIIFQGALLSSLPTVFLFRSSLGLLHKRKLCLVYRVIM